MKQKKRTQKKESRTSFNDAQSLNDLGIDPPKIYRDSQKAIYDRQDKASAKRRSATHKKNSKNNMTRAEKRHRDSKKRKKRNTFRKVLIWLIVIIMLASVGTVLSLTVFFRINEVTVGGNTIYSEEEILAQCTIDKGENLFLSDIKTAKDMLEQNLPYIYNAEIKRKLPYTIEINITEAEPAFSIRNKDKTYILLDDNFKVLEADAKKASGITISKAAIHSADLGRQITFKDADVSDCLNQLATVVKDNRFDEITAIYCNNISDNYVVYDGRIEFKLGTCENLENKIYQGLTACEKLNQSNPNAKGVMTITGDKSLYFTEK